MASVNNQNMRLVIVSKKEMIYQLSCVDWVQKYF
jgi:hypothetical protein